MIVTAIVLAIVAAAIDYWVGIKEPWRKIIYIGIIILLVVGVILLLFPGVLPINIGRY
jgi:hypothetical protein